jgi:hypothetical protein
VAYKFVKPLAGGGAHTDDFTFQLTTLANCHKDDFTSNNSGKDNVANLDPSLIHATRQGCLAALQQARRNATNPLRINGPASYLHHLSHNSNSSN